MGICIRRIFQQQFFRQGQRDFSGFIYIRDPTPNELDGERKGQNEFREKKLAVESHCFLTCLFALDKIASGQPVNVLHRVVAPIDGGIVVLILARKSTRGLLPDRFTQISGDDGADFVLQFEDIIEFSIEFLRPDLSSVVARGKLQTDSNTRPRSL